MPENNTQIHNNLYAIRDHLQSIYLSAASFEPLIQKPPIIDTSIEEDSQWRSESVPGMRLLREAIKGDLERLETFLADSDSVNLPAISTNSPYLIAVWNEILCATYPVISIFRLFHARGGQSAQQRRRRGDAHNSSPDVKVDVVCNGGAQWIRINTIKNSRILAEFREIDSYKTDSESESEDTSDMHRPTLAQKEFDNSVLRMARSLWTVSRQNPIPGTADFPTVTLRLTRLDPGEFDADPRIAQTVQILLNMGIDVQLGERESTNTPLPPSNGNVRHFQPSLRVNLDLSAVIALVSDLTHAPLPQNTDEANTRFQPSQKYLDWKKQRINISQSGKQKKAVQGAGNGGHGSAPDRPGQNTHARALTNQVMQETVKGLLEEMRDRLCAVSNSRDVSDNIEFWTTPEVRDRCLRIVSKIGGPGERRRANALFLPSTSESTALEEREAQYWRDSRYLPRFIPILPMRIYPSSEPALATPPLADYTASPAARSPFFRSLASSCRDILAQETAPHPRALPASLVQGPADAELAAPGEIQRALVTKANPHLTAHTVQSMLWGAELGWTTLTANKSSVKAIWRDMRLTWDSGKRERLEKRGDMTEEGQETAGLWIVDPRSLAEGQRADYTE